jgi:hypothetical protein
MSLEMLSSAARARFAGWAVPVLSLLVLAIAAVWATGLSPVAQVAAVERSAADSESASDRAPTAAYGSERSTTVEEPSIPAHPVEPDPDEDLPFGPSTAQHGSLPPLVAAVRAKISPADRRARMIAAIAESGPASAETKRAADLAFAAWLRGIPESRRGPIHCHRSGCMVDLVFDDAARAAQAAKERATTAIEWAGARAVSPADERRDGAHVTWFLVDDGAS